jgi:hypothetical protein
MIQATTYPNFSALIISLKHKAKHSEVLPEVPIGCKDDDFFTFYQIFNTKSVLYYPNLTLKTLKSTKKPPTVVKICRW